MTSTCRIGEHKYNLSNLMGTAPALSSELTKQSIALARALSAAARIWGLYPPEHPAVEASVSRLADAVRTSTGGAAFSFGVTPETLLVAGLPLPDEQAVAEAARLLHDRDILSIMFLGEVPQAALHSFLKVLSTPSDDLRASGGPASAWEAEGHSSISIEQIDYEKILADRELQAPLDKRDDVWRSLVNQIVAGGHLFDEGQQQRLLQISGSVPDIADLATDVMAPKRTADGAPLITTQAATVLAVFRHLTSIVNVMEPERMQDVMRNVAAATSRLDPHVVLQLMQSEDSAQEIPIVARLATTFDDDTVAQMLATAMSRDGKATERLAQVFDTIAPDDERKRRVLRMSRTLLSESDFGKAGQFKAAWASMEELLVSYNEKPFVSEDYQAALGVAGARADMLAMREVPPEWADWVDTLKQDNVRRLSVMLITDLLRIEEHADRAAEIAGDMIALADDLLLSGSFDDLLVVAQALRQGADRDTAVAPAACRAAMTAIADTLAMREAASLLGELDEEPARLFAACCAALGPACVAALRPVLEAETETPAYVRARDIVRGYGAGAIKPLSAMIDDSRWFVHRNVALLLGITRSAEAVPSLQVLLRRNDPRVLRAAVSALASIDDPSAARAIQTVLRAATGESRAAVVEALVAERDGRVVPMLVRILAESDPFGSDHQTVLDALGAVRELADERAVPPVVSVMRKRRLFARRKSRAFKQASVDALCAIGTPKARQALEDAERTGDRLLRRIVRNTISGPPRT
jgi:HEAT repeat protein